MEKSKDSAKQDIAQQPYKGPSAIAAGLGQGAVQTKFLTLAGLGVGTIAALIFPTKAKTIVEKIQINITRASESSNSIKKLGGKVANLFLDFGKHIAEFLQNIGVVKDHLGKFDQNRVKTIVDSAIITSAGAGILGGLFGGGLGIRSARAGRKQFETAKAEISTLRGQLLNTKAELEDAKTANAARKGTLKVADDEPPVLEAPTSTNTPLMKAPTANWADDIAAQKAQQSEVSLA